MKHFLGYRCSICGSEFLPDQVAYNCPKDEGNLDVLLDFEEINRKTTRETIRASRHHSLWRYLPLLPVSDPGGEGTPLHAAGFTPIFSPPALKEQLGLQHLWIKDESRNPTASFKDRASAVAVARAREIVAEVIVTASSGNAGAALAGMSAAVGQKAVILVPKTAPPAKVAQLLIYGATVLLVDGTYDDAFDLTLEASREFGWYCRNTGYNPFTLEGKKTAAFEIWEQLLGDWSIENRELSKPLSTLRSPFSIFVSVGDGNIISGIHKGFKDLLALGWLEQMPRLYGVQAEGSAAVANAFRGGTEVITPVEARTLADSISVGLPRDGVRAVRAATQTGGSYITVSDEQILSAIAALGKTGIFAEPAGAAAYAGLVKMVEGGIIQRRDPVVVINTGSGLKDVGAAMKVVSSATVIEPHLQALKRALGR
ncbi:MAG TPA: threonine synthase [Anaerolineales bacterium]|nr:threonine synthase [Anaerolineales bacterium]